MLKDPEGTRSKVLQAAFAEIHEVGYQAASLDHILKNSGVSKGALYHHFKNKKALGLAVINEMIALYFNYHFIEPVRKAEKPIEKIKEVLCTINEENEKNVSQLGCPLNNLINEMSPVDEDFRQALEKIIHDWWMAYIDAIKMGKKMGFVRTNVNEEESGCFIIASYEGAMGLGKTFKNPMIFRACQAQLSEYIDSLES